MKRVAYICSIVFLISMAAFVSFVGSVKAKTTIIHDCSEPKWICARLTTFRYLYVFEKDEWLLFKEHK